MNSSEQHAGIETVVQGNTRFALDLYARLRTAEGNLFFSPYSISAALAMTYAGARGDTAAQMARTLCLSLDQAALHPAFAALKARLDDVGKRDQVQLAVANSLWPDRGFLMRDAFVALTRQYYGVEITAVDYGDPEAAVRIINAWVETQTGGKVRKLLVPVMVIDAALVLVNAIYFKGVWASRFDPQDTRKARFQVTPAQQIAVEMMTQTRAFPYLEDQGLQVLELPYAGEAVSMVVLLPGAGDGLERLEASLTAANLEGWMAETRVQPVAVSLPRFEIAGSFRMKEVLKAMGMTDAFSGGADFSGISEGPLPLFISEVVHKAVVSVSEEGSEAAAATAVVMSRGLSIESKPPPAFCADRPFVFSIRDNGTGSILFLGRVTNPVPGAA